jgi:hypothetical protein
MRAPGHRFTYRDLVSGNLSIAAQVYARVGGFDPAFPNAGGEDYEFGIRLIKADVPFAIAAEARARHYDLSNTDRSFLRAQQEGLADVLIGRRHPDMLPALPLAQYDTYKSPLSRRLRPLAFKDPVAGNAQANALRSRLDRLERMRRRGRWRALYNAVHNYWYWRGVANELGTPKALAGLLQSGPARPDIGYKEIELDLSQGWTAAENTLDAERPDGARIRYGPYPIGRVLPWPGSEKLRGAHLRRQLVTYFAVPLLKAIALDQVVVEPVHSQDRLDAGPLALPEVAHAHQST